MKKLLLLLTLCLTNILTSSATHLMGGEITWVCLPNGQFQFTMKLYRDCNSGLLAFDVSNGIEVFNYPTQGSPTFHMPVTLISQTDISSSCISCDNPGGSPGVVEEFIYQTAPVTLTGTPPAQGWVFSFDNCCRNAGLTNILNASNEGFTLRAKMFANNGSNTNPCYDSSPVFAERPSLVTCAGNAFTYVQNAYDNEHDSLSYSWDRALDDFATPWNEPSNPTTLTYNTGYSPQSPLPGIIHDASNQPAVLDPNTGAISFLSYTSGNFTTVVKVEAWKCGAKVAEIYREIQITIVGCSGNNTAPAVTPPFQDINGNYTLYADTVTAGELVSFTMTGTDNGTVILEAGGNQFGTNYTNANSGCLYPPCATLSSTPPSYGTNTVSTNFNWQTDCSHVNQYNECVALNSTYTFVFHLRDNVCPVPGESIALVSITVLGDSVVASPSLRCASVLANGDVELTWSSPVNAGNTFDSYHIYHSGSADGPFTAVDSIFNINTTSYNHAGANANTGPQYYYIRTRSGCNGAVYNTAPDTLATIFPVINDPGDGIADLSWNPLSAPLPGSTLNGYYRIYRMLPGNSWTLIDSTLSLTYHDTVSVCNDSIYYRVEIADNSGCISTSAITGDTILSDNVVADFTTTFIIDHSYVFLNQSDNALYYSWDFGDGATSTLENTTHNFSDTGIYTITLVAWNACDSDTFVVLFVVTGINDIEHENIFVIYPNPAKNTITIQTASGIKPQEVEIVNTLGQVVTSSVVEKEQSTFDISKLSNGVYYLFLENEQGKRYAKKFVIARD
jgi:PKD repeat protein